MSGSSSLRALVRSFIPALSHDLHKGQCGRIGIIGGCKEYTGAPYFAAISALKVGADLSHVFCNSAAAPVIKSYSPDLIVHPILDSGAECLVEMKKWMPRLHVLVIGPGLGRETSILNTVKGIMKEATKRDLPMVIDADGLFLVTQDPETVRNNRNVILTPNIMEFSRLYNAVLGLSAPCDVKPDDVRELSKQLGNVTIVSKGKTDIITNGSSCIECCESGSLRRCGGQGDLLSGAMGTFVHWACWAQKGGRGSSEFSSQGPMMSAAYAACELTRQCSARAFTTVGRSMNTTDMITQIQHAYYQLYEA